ncbi:ribonuclease H-like domain-containing protein [Candidatus Woesearchaeota archaeon]|nr:ribonuclease H-like domain-containing protein [Candidatus Woesearchaeota archaeon]
MEDNHFVIDIETCPISTTGYMVLSEEEKLKLINPIDSKVIALGIRHNNEDIIFIGDDEKRLLENFWNKWRAIKETNPVTKIIGFNLIDFDLSFLTTRSLINNVQICPFVLKHIVDLRDKISAYRNGKTKGKLKDFAPFMGLTVKEIDGSNIADLWMEKKYDIIKDYLINDLKITEELYKRTKETNIIYIERW